MYIYICIFGYVTASFPNYTTFFEVSYKSVTDEQVTILQQGFMKLIKCCAYALIQYIKY